MSLHPADLDPETRYELAKLRMQLDRSLNAHYRHHGTAAAFAEDPELVCRLDALDALIEITNLEADV